MGTQGSLSRYSVIRLAVMDLMKFHIFQHLTYSKTFFVKRLLLNIAVSLYNGLDYMDVIVPRGKLILVS